MKTLVKLYLWFLLVYLGDHAITLWGLRNGAIEGNRLAEAWYEHGATVALAMKAFGAGLVALGVVLVPRLHPKGYAWAVVGLGCAITFFAIVDAWNVIHAAATFCEGLPHPEACTDETWANITRS